MGYIEWRVTGQRPSQLSNLKVLLFGSMLLFHWIYALMIFWSMAPKCLTHVGNWRNCMIPRVGLLSLPILLIWSRFSSLLVNVLCLQLALLTILISRGAQYVLLILMSSAWCSWLLICFAKTELLNSFKTLALQWKAAKMQLLNCLQHVQALYYKHMSQTNLEMEDKINVRIEGIKNNKADL